MYRVNPISGRRRVGGICDRLSPIKGVRRQVSSMALTVGSHLSSKLWRCKTSVIISDWLSAEAAKSNFSNISCKHTPALVPRGKWWISRPSESGGGRFSDGMARSALSAGSMAGCKGSCCSSVDLVCRLKPVKLVWRIKSKSRRLMLCALKAWSCWRLY